MIDGKERREIKKEEEEIKIDYENIDVADIMEQIKRRIAKRLKMPLEEAGREKLPFTAPDRVPLELKENAGIKNKIKRLLLKIMKPFAPLIKLFILPVYQEFREAFLILDRTNRRLDSLNAAMEQGLADLSTAVENAERRLDDIGQSLNQRIDAVSQTLNQKLDDVGQNLNQRLNLAFDDLGKTMEYTKLLHNLSHNIVVELSKLKIEAEDLKLKTRIMEKDFEFLGKRERSLEKQIFR